MSILSSLISLSTIVGCVVGAVCLIRDDFVEIDLRLGVVRGYSPYISFLVPPTQGAGNHCDRQTVIKINFEKKYRGAKFHLHYGESPRLWTVDISDSPSGDGYGGDNRTTSNMAETQIHNRQMRIYGNNLSGHMDASTNGGLLIRTVDNFVKKGSRATLDISDERIAWTYNGVKDLIQSRFLYTLRGQPPEYGMLDYDVFVGFNRVVAGTFRNGSGICRASIKLYGYTGKF